MSKSHQGRNRKKRGVEEMKEKFNEKLSEVNTRAACRGQNELVGELRIAAGDVISIGGRL